MGAELDEQVDVALAGAEVVAQGGAEDVEARHAVPGAQLGDRLTFVLQHVDHGEHLRRHATRVRRGWPQWRVADAPPDVRLTHRG